MTKPLTLFFPDRAMLADVLMLARVALSSLAPERCECGSTPNLVYNGADVTASLLEAEMALRQGNMDMLTDANMDTVVSALRDAALTVAHTSADMLRARLAGNKRTAGLAVRPGVLCCGDTGQYVAVIGLQRKASAPDDVVLLSAVDVTGLLHHGPLSRMRGTTLLSALEEEGRYDDEMAAIDPSEFEGPFSRLVCDGDDVTTRYVDWAGNLLHANDATENVYVQFGPTVGEA